MKKYIILLIALIIGVFATAQTVTYPTIQSDVTYTYVATDYNLTQIATATWKGTTADTVIILSNTTANRYRYFKITLTGTGTGVTKVSDQELKLWRE